MRDTKLDDSSDLFSQALAVFLKAPQDRLAFAGASKCFEVAFEYAWKWFTRQADDPGLRSTGRATQLKRRHNLASSRTSNGGSAFFTLEISQFMTTSGSPTKIS